jgi:membrane protein DedA with SNARE-associated domain
MESIFEWLVTLPVTTLYAVLALTAAIENIIPPFPSDVTVAFGSFVVAQGHKGTLLGVFLATWSGNVAGAMLVYVLGRRYGGDRLERRLAGKKAESMDARLRSLFARYGMPAVFVSRFVPGVRAIVPAFAGALRVPVWEVLLMVGTASAIWYGLITFIAFRVGSDWENLRDKVMGYSTTLGIVGTAILVGGIIAWLLVRRRRQRR